MPAVPRQPGSRLLAAPLLQPKGAKGAPAPPQLRGDGSRRGSGELPRAGRQHSGIAPGPEPGVSHPGAAGGLCQSSTSELCPPGVLQCAAPRRGALPGSRGSPARALPGSAAFLRPPGRCLRGPHLASTGCFPLAPLHRRLPLLPSKLPALRRVPPLSTQHFQQEGAARVSRSPLPAARAGRLRAAPGETARPPAGRRGGGSRGRRQPGTAALELTRVLMRRRGLGTPGARPARSAHPGLPAAPGHGAGGLRSQIWSEMALWMINAPACLFGERALK